jgi:hypothetical protein
MFHIRNVNGNQIFRYSLGRSLMVSVITLIEIFYDHACKMPMEGHFRLAAARMLLRAGRQLQVKNRS